MRQNKNKGKQFESIIAISKARKLGFVKNPNSERGEDTTIFFDDLMHAFPGDKVLVEMVGEKTNEMERAIVLEILERPKTKFVGTVEKAAKCYVLPDSQKMYVDFVLDESDCGKVEHDDKIFIEFEKWSEKDKNPTARLLEVIGKKGVHEVEMRAIVLEKGFDADFPPKVLDEADKLKNKWKTIPEEEIQKRRDMRKTTTFTIDPADAKDFDDALSFKKLENGNYEVGVHIADVSHYVKPNSVLDEEALERAFSVYLVDRTIPMLPEVLSNDLCSLNPEEEKLAFSAIFEIDQNAKVKKEWFGRTIIKSDHRFSYESAQKAIDNSASRLPELDSGSQMFKTPDQARGEEKENKNEKFSEILTILNDIAKKLENQKNKNGAIKFIAEEFEFELNPEGVPLKIVKKKFLDTHKLIENFMLLANQHVAKFIYDFFKKKSENIPSLMFRVHNVPDKDKIVELGIFIKALGYKLNIQENGEVTAKDLNALFTQVEGKAEEALINSAAIKTMTKAIYSPENSGHFGLAFEYYTHFTSPIRRYPDLVVHRILEKLLKGQRPSQKETAEFEKIALHSTNQEIAAQDAERSSIKYKQVEFMQNHIGEEFEGIISGVAPFGLFVILNDTGAEGMVHISKLGEDYWQLDEKNYRVVGEKTHQKFTLGDKVKVKIESADLDQKKLDMRFV
jgi:ribonuclease R